MKFSIVTPVLNGMPQLQRCVGSVRGQKDADYEHIIQDGGSVDGAVPWLKAQPDLNVNAGSDRGMYAAINKGWSRASNDILSWLNADEQYLPGTLAFVDGFLKARPDVDVLFGNAIIVDSQGLAIAARREIPLRAVYVRNSFLYALSCTIFFRRSLWDDGLLRFDPTFQYAGDTDLILRLLSHGVKFHHVDRYFSLFGVDGKNMSVSQGMAAERNILYARYGAFKSIPVRKALMSARYVERLFAGCYRKDIVNYSYAFNEIPEYVHYNNVKSGFRFSYERYLNGSEK